MTINTPENPVTELTEEQLQSVVGGNRPSMPRAGKEAEGLETADD